MRFAVFVAAGLASLVASDETLACPVPPACDCSSYDTQVKDMIAQRDNCLRTKVAELSAKDATLTSKSTEHAQQLAKAQAEVEQYRKSVGEWTTRSTELEKQVSTLQSQAAKGIQADEISRQLATLEKSHKELQEKSASDIATWRTVLNDAQKQSTACEKSQTSLKHEFDTYRQSAGRFETRVSDLQAQVHRYETDLAATKSQLHPLVSVVYSKSHVMYALSHTLRIGKAFGAFAHKRITTVLGPDFVKLVKLQAVVWGNRAQAKAIEIGTPWMVKAAEFYNQKLEIHCTPIIAHSLEFKDTMMVTAKDLGAKFLVLTERLMNRTIRNLSSVDPTIGEVFGDDFTDRCFAFAFILLCVWVVSSVVSWAFNVFIGAPFCWLFGIGKTKTKKGKQTSGSKSSKGDSSKGKTTVKGSANAKEGGKADSKAAGKMADGKSADGKAGLKSETKKPMDKGTTDKGTTETKKPMDKGVADKGMATGDVKISTTRKVIKA